MCHTSKKHYCGGGLSGEKATGCRTKVGDIDPLAMVLFTGRDAAITVNSVKNTSRSNEVFSRQYDRPKKLITA